MQFRINLIQKFIAFLLLAAVFPLLIVGVAAYQVSRTIVRDEAIRFTQTLVDAQRDYLDLQAQQIASLMANLLSVEEITDALASDAQTNAYTSLATQARLGYILDSYSNLQGLVSLDIFTMRGAHYHVGDTLDVSRVRTEVLERILAEARIRSPDVVWAGIEDNVNASSNQAHVLTAARLVLSTRRGSTTSEPVALLLVNSSVDELHTHFERVNLGTGATLLIIDAQGRAMYHPDRQLLGTTINHDIRDAIQGPQGTVMMEIDSQPLLLTYSTSSMSGWMVLSLVPLATLDAQASTIGLTVLLALAVACLIVALTATFASHVIVIPLRNLTRHLQLLQAGKQGWDTPLPVHGSDEVAELSRWFNTFLETLRARNHAEEALRESEERYALALQGANDGIWDWDLRTNHVHYSARWQAILGYADAALLTSIDAWLDQVHPDDVALVRQQLEAQRQGTTALFESEHRIWRSADQVYLWVLARGMTVADAQQRPMRIAGSLTDISKRKQVEAQLRHEAFHDALTGLPNRAYVMEQLEPLLVYARANHEPCAALLYLDFDRFKLINDSLGHAAGDVVLRMLAQRMTANLRPTDVLARLGGDEFVLLLNQLGQQDDVKAVAARIQAQLAYPMEVQGLEVTLHASIGVVLITENYTSGEDLLRDADTAMYEAKANGRACTVVFNPEMHTRTLQRVRLEADLRRAISRDELRLHYQPIQNLHTGAVQSFEALVRWQHPEHGLVSPGVFIPIAEETGLIQLIDMWVLRTACHQLKNWHDQGHVKLRVSVNLSARNFQTDELPQIIQQILREEAMQPTAIQLEITESAVMLDIEHTCRLLDQLTGQGMRISIDDFGTHYSSLAYLKRLPADSVKIDRSFVNDVTTSHDAAAIVHAIIAIGHILGMTVIAEGVETEAQCAFLQAQQCDAIQGYLLSPAVEATVAEQMLVTGWHRPQTVG